MSGSRFESYEDILLALVNEPLSLLDLAVQTCLKRDSLGQYLQTLIASGLIEKRSVREITIVYAITEKGLAVIRALSFQKYLERIGGMVRTIDEAQRVIPELSSRHNASESES
jgi:predicted transcriptional regulator